MLTFGLSKLDVQCTGGVAVFHIVILFQKECQDHLMGKMIRLHIPNPSGCRVGERIPSPQGLLARSLGP